MSVYPRGPSDHPIIDLSPAKKDDSIIQQLAPPLLLFRIFPCLRSTTSASLQQVVPKLNMSPIGMFIFISGKKYSYIQVAHDLL